MRICHVTPHLPPDQAANALLPFHLGSWARARGDDVSYLAHPPRSAAGTDDAAAMSAGLPGPVTWIAPRRRGPAVARALKLSGVAATVRVTRQVRPLVAAADLVHVHSNGLLAEVAALVASRLGKPTILTLYGTEIWHYRRLRFQPDLFTRAYRSATEVTFYSQGLLDRALALGLGRPALSVVYPPVAAEFRFCDKAGQADVRRALGVSASHLLVNVKRLHTLAGQRYLIEAMPTVVQTFPECCLVVCGTGDLRAELEQLADRLGVSRHVRFLGLVDNERVARYDMAADVFVLPSLLEACPTVALEALACGTPVISSDNPGGVELGALFGPDVTVIPREDSGALAQALIRFLEAPRRVLEGTAARIERDFRPGAVDARFRAVYAQAIAAGRGR
jgi:glycosyltransferase involved in cell wall biosynthesis